MGHEILPRPLTRHEFDAMMSELDDAQVWMIEQLRRRPMTAQESACHSAKLRGGTLGGDAKQRRLQAKPPDKM